MQDARRLEIEAKKNKLAALRQAREQREERKSALLTEQRKRGSEASSSPAPSAPSSSRREIDTLVASLLGPSATSASSSASGSYPPTEALSPHSSAPSTPAYGNSTFLPSMRSGMTPTRGSIPRESEGEGGDDNRISPFRPGLPDLIDVQTEMYELPPKQKLTYTKAVQTSYHPSSDSDSDDDPSRPRRSATTSTSTGTGTGTSTRETEEEMRKRFRDEFEEEKRKLDEEIEEERKRLEREVEEERVRELTEDQRAQIESAPEFLEFVESSSKIVQRALSDGYDYIRDYTLGADGNLNDEEGKTIKLVCSFSDERWTKGRSVTGLDWSPKYPELSVASYNKNPAAVNDPDGLVCVWNMHLVERPEFIFHSQTDVLSVSFSPFHSNLIFGGTYSGQILLWDTRAKHLPVLKTPLSAAGHTYPVYAMKMVGTQNAHNLITSSTDGMVCSWLADMLAQPQETLELQHSSTHVKTDEVSITTLDFPDNETTTFWVGTEEGNVYQANRYDRAGAKAGLNQHDIYKGHSGPVTGLHFHPLVGTGGGAGGGGGGVDFSDLFLTCSVDWTVKLWRAKGAAGANGTSSGGGGGLGTSGSGSAAGGTTTNAAGTTNVKPVHSFEEATDYVYDVRWHPVNPAVFGSVDGTGKFDLWNLNVDTEVPTLSVQTPSLKALNKLAWDKKDGRRAALGSSDGTVYVYDVGEAAVPRESEWSELQKTVAGLMSASQQASGGAGGGLGVPLAGR